MGQISDFNVISQKIFHVQLLLILLILPIHKNVILLHPSRSEQYKLHVLLQIIVAPVNDSDPYANILILSSPAINIEFCADKYPPNSMSNVIVMLDSAHDLNPPHCNSDDTIVD